MLKQLELGDVRIEVEFKDIKNVHLSVFPPAGRVRIAAPRRLSLDTVRVYAISKLRWIKQQQKKLREQERETPRELLDRESHFVWGQRYLLAVEERDEKPSLKLRAKKMLLIVRPGMPPAKRKEFLDGWYRAELRTKAAKLLAKWEPVLGVEHRRLYVQRMRTKWGSCSLPTKNIRLNTDLAKKPPECLEYIVVHELMHLLEPSHNARFITLMDRFMPNWRIFKARLNSLPLRQEDWTY